MNTLNRPQIDSVPELKAIGLLIFDYSAQEMVDVYGSVPYGDFLANKMEAPFTFDPGSKIYETIILSHCAVCGKHFRDIPDKSGIGVGFHNHSEPEAAAQIIAQSAGAYAGHCRKTKQHQNEAHTHNGCDA